MNMDETILPIDQIDFKVGEHYRFWYGPSSKESKPRAEGHVSVRIRPTVVVSVIAGIVAGYPEKKRKNSEIIERLAPLWRERKSLEAKIEEAAEIKKSQKIRLWEDFGRQNPGLYQAKLNAEAVLADVTEQLKKEFGPVTPAGDREELPVDRVATFFRSYSIKPIDPATAYVIDAWYCGERLIVTNGNMLPLFLVTTGSVAEADFNEKTFERVVS